MVINYHYDITPEAKKLESFYLTIVGETDGINWLMGCGL